MNQEEATRPSVATLLTNGWYFFRDHPQLWSTLLIACIISLSYVFVAYNFGSVAYEVSEELQDEKAGWLVDGLALFVAEEIHSTAELRSKFVGLKKMNPVLESILVLEHTGAGQWRTLVHTDPSKEESVQEYDLDRSAAFAFALNSDKPTVARVGSGNGRIFVTARRVEGLRDESNNMLVVTEVSVAQSDRVIEDKFTYSMVFVVVVLVAILFLFFRHARIVDFAVLYKKQLEVDKMKDSFLSMASHELKSPLSVIRGYIEYLEDDSLPPETRQEFVKRIGLSADELRQLVEDILDVSRIEMGRLRFSPDHVVPREVIEEVMEMFKLTAEGKGLKLRMIVPDDVHEVGVLVDRGRLKQILVNLTSNALKYTRKGSVTLGIAVHDGFVECSIRDTGVGMTAAEQERLFSKFYRVQTEETKSVRGTGLGLWITKYLIEHMNGTITVESIKGEGSRFVVAFPVHEHASDTLENSNDSAAS